MKVLPTARILLVDSQPERRKVMRDALTAFGIGEVQEAATLADASAVSAIADVDILVVRVDDATRVPDAPHREKANQPAILIANAPVQMLLRAAAAGGYEGVLGDPLTPRLVYRRIGSVLQRSRREMRVGSTAIPRIPVGVMAAKMIAAAPASAVQSSVRAGID